MCCIFFHKHNRSLTDILAQIRQPVTGESQVLLINRKNILKSTIFATRRPGFSFNRPVTVMFSGEEAFDDGGPRREYFRYILEHFSLLFIYIKTGIF